MPNKNILFCVLLLVSCTGGNNSANHAGFEITTIAEGHAMLEPGCSCYYARNLEELMNQQYIYLADYGNRQVISIDNESVILDKTSQQQETFSVEIKITSEERVGYEVTRHRGTLIISNQKGEKVELEFVGYCGC